MTASSIQITGSEQLAAIIAAKLNIDVPDTSCTRPEHKFWGLKEFASSIYVLLMGLSGIVESNQS